MSQLSSIISADSFKSACCTVRAELKKLGFWSKKLANVTVRQTYFGFSYGWQYYRGCGDIVIPKISVIRMYDSCCRGDSMPLRDVLRHEYGHAVADNHRSLVKSSKFRDVFGAAHDNLECFHYSDKEHVSYYASDNVGEDFAETFMYFIKYKGKLPKDFDTPAIRKKWNFVKYLGNRFKDIE